MTMNMKLARGGDALEKHDTTILRAPTDSTRKSQTAVLVGAVFPTVASGAEEDDEENEEDEEDEEDEDEDEDEEDEPDKSTPAS